MKVLVTGSRGLVGASVSERLRTAGHEVVGYDLLDAQDILQPEMLREATRGCDAIVHSAALLGRAGESAEQIMAINLQGTWIVLRAGVESGVQRVVFLSSVDSLGVFKGERTPDYLPLDDAHPCYPATPYAISKYLAEAMCRVTSQAEGLPIICLRPPGVWSEKTYARILAERAKRAAFEWDPFWEYGAFIDVRDLTGACLRALTCDADGFHCVLVASSDITTSGRTSRELAQMIHPDVEWRGSEVFELEPYSTLVDISGAQELLHWTPRHTWRAYLEPEAVTDGQDAS